MESKFLGADAQTACVCRNEEKERMFVAMIAQGRVHFGGGTCITDWQVSLGKSLLGCYCLVCTPPAGSESLYICLTCKPVKETPGDTGQADVGTHLWPVQH